MSINDFFDLKTLATTTMRQTIRFADGEKLNWLNVKSIRFLKATPDQIAVKYTHSEDFKVIFIYYSSSLVTNCQYYFN